MTPNRRAFAGRAARLATIALLAAACQAPMPADPPPAAPASARTAAPADRWPEGRIGVTRDGRTALVCRTEDGRYFAFSAEGFPLLHSEGDRDHIAAYLDGENLWSAAFTPVTTLKELWASSDQSETLDYSQYALGAFTRAVGTAGLDKRKHFEVSYGLMLASLPGEDVLDNLLLGPMQVLKIGVQKELEDRSIPQDRRRALYAALDRATAELQQATREIRELGLDRGDLVADVAGIAYGVATKGASALEGRSR